MEPPSESTGTTNHLSGARPFKIARSEHLSYGGASVSDTSDHIEQSTAAIETDTETERQKIRTRANTACQTCRARKTKCDNLRPRCSYCARVQADCSYVEDGQRPQSCDVFGPKILDAIESLSNLIQHRQNGIIASSPVASVDTYSSPFGQILDARTADNYYDFASHVNRPSNAAETEKSVLPPVRLNKRAFAPQGLAQILEWNVFPPGTSQCASQHDPAQGHGLRSAQTSRLPELSYATLNRLKMRYIAGVHVKNPFLDIPQLEELILQVIEYGFDWSVNTCLVALTCSIGALAETFASNFLDGDNDTPGSSHSSDEKADMELAMQFWNVAVRRLGLVIGESSLISVQCLCLAGIWYMHMIQPLQAWKYFGLAGNTYLTLPKRESNFDSAHMLRLEQTVWFTVYKSECELRLELPLPPSILGDIDTQYTFPFPPQFELHLPSNDPLDTERGWYYYLAEIAARHLFNHLLRTRSSNPPTCTAKSINAMISQLSLFEPQVHEWYASLPAPIKFDLPAGNMTPLHDELSHILRGRYLGLRELLYRPFIQLCIENDLCGSVPRELVEKVTALASKNLDYCVFKLQIMITKRHQGTWSVLRQQLTYAFILLAANRAAKRKHTDRRAMAMVAIPASWREVVEITLKRTAAYWEEDSGIGGPARLLRDMLNEESESSSAWREADPGCELAQ